MIGNSSAVAVYVVQQKRTLKVLLSGVRHDYIESIIV